MDEATKRKRKNKITSSVVAAALGVDEYSTPLQAALSIRGELPDFFGSKATERGHILEPLVLEYPVRSGLALAWSSPGYIDHPKHDWAGDSADAVYALPDGVTAVGEAKTVGAGNAHLWGEDGTEDIPQHALYQSIWHLIHYPDAKHCIVPALFGGYSFEFRSYKVHRDKRRESALLEQMYSFWNDHINCDSLPDAQARDSEVLRRIYHKSIPEMAEPTSELTEAVREKIRSADELKRAKAADDAAKARVQQLLGAKEGIDCEAGKIYWRTSKGRSSVNWESVARSISTKSGLDTILPNVIEQYTKEGAPYRVLRTYKPRGQK